MAETLASISFRAAMTCSLKNAAIDGSTLTASVTQGKTLTIPSLSSGTGADAMDRAWGDTDRTLSSSATENIDVYDLASIDIGAGAGLSALGQAITFTEIVGLLIQNKSTSSGTLIVGGEGSSATWNSVFNASDTAKLSLPPSGLIFLACFSDPAFAVADSSNHLLKFEASGGAVTYSIFIFGRSA